MANPDIEITTDDTLELDAIIKAWNAKSNSLVDVTDGTEGTDFNLEGIQTNTAIFDPINIGTYNINVNGQELTIKVTEASSIPDSVVYRPDNNAASGSNVTKEYGVRISVSQNWDKIQGELGSVDSSVSNAYVYRTSDSNLMGRAEISGNKGEIFTIDLSNPLSKGETYNFVVDASGGGYTTHYYGGSSGTYTSDDGNLKIIEGAKGTGTETPNRVHNIIRLGNINL